MVCVEIGHNEVMSTLTAEQSDLVRGAVFGAMALVSKADPGFFAMFRESLAGARALAAAPPEIRELLGTGFVAPPSGAAQDREGAVVAQLQQARDMLAVTAPELLDGFRGVVLSACQATAQADDGVSDSERATIATIENVLSAGGGASIVPSDSGAAAGVGAGDTAAGPVADADGPIGAADTPRAGTAGTAGTVVRTGESQGNPTTPLIG